MQPPENKKTTKPGKKGLGFLSKKRSDGLKLKLK